MLPRLNFGYLLARLGLDAERAPALLTTVQPTAHVGDWSALVPPILAPRALVGGYTIATSVLRVAAFQLISNAPGGMQVEWFAPSCDHSDTGVDDWELASIKIADPLAMTNPQTLTAQILGPVAPQSYGQLGEISVGDAGMADGKLPFILLQPRAAVPTGANTGVQGPIVPGPFYVPPGKCLRVAIANRAATSDRSYLTAIIRDYPAPLT